MNVARALAFGDVVEGNEAAGPHERRVQLEVTCDTVLRVVAVDEEQVERSAAELAFDD